MQTNAKLLYLDSSALVKLAIVERESEALTRLLTSGALQTSCALAQVEVMRTVRPHGEQARARARRVLAAVSIMQLEDPLLDLAAAIGTMMLRSLDAIHLAAAARLAPNVEVVTYDRRLADAARAIGLPVVSPGS